MIHRPRKRPRKRDLLEAAPDWLLDAILWFMTALRTLGWIMLALLFLSSAILGLFINLPNITSMDFFFWLFSLLH